MTLLKNTNFMNNTNGLPLGNPRVLRAIRGKFSGLILLNQQVTPTEKAMRHTTSRQCAK